jgi:hypothetical protein
MRRSGHGSWWVLNHPDIWEREDVGRQVTAGETYAPRFVPPYPGVWRLQAHVGSQYHCRDVSNGDFRFTSPAAGQLDYLLMYLYDRTADTPRGVTTPMDVYRDVSCAEAGTC